MLNLIINTQDHFQRRADAARARRMGSEAVQAPQRVERRAAPRGYVTTKFPFLRTALRGQVQVDA